jgi:hypothetical protein
VSAGADKVIRFWDEEGKVIRKIKADSAVECLAFSPDGKILAAGYFDRSIRLWDTVSTEMTRKLVGLKNAPIQLVFSPDGKVLGSAGDHDVARFWDVSTGKEISKTEDREERHQSIRTVKHSPREVPTRLGRGHGKGEGPSGMALEQGLVHGLFPGQDRRLGRQGTYPAAVGGSGVFLGKSTIGISVGPGGPQVETFDGATSVRRRQASRVASGE